MSYEIRAGVIVRLADLANIPTDPVNIDYRAYLAWVALGNTAQVIPNPPVPPVELVREGAKAAAAAIPDWATNNEDWILAWLDTNIGTPLTTPIPPNPITNIQIRAVLVSIVTILGFIYTAIKANARMSIALRNRHWPDMQE